MREYYLAPIPIIYTKYLDTNQYKAYGNYLGREYVNDTYNKIESFDVCIGRKEYVKNQIQVSILLSPIFITKNINKIELNDTLKNNVINTLYKYLNKISKIIDKEMINDNKTLLIPYGIDTWIYVSSKANPYDRFKRYRISLKGLHDLIIN